MATIKMKTMYRRKTTVSQRMMVHSKQMSNIMMTMKRKMTEESPLLFEGMVKMMTSSRRLI